MMSAICMYMHIHVSIYSMHACTCTLHTCTCACMYMYMYTHNIIYMHKNKYFTVCVLHKSNEGNYNACVCKLHIALRM